MTQRRQNSHQILAVMPEQAQSASEAFFLVLEEVEAPESYYEVDDQGIARVSIMGPLGRRNPGFGYSGTDTQVLENDFRVIAADPLIKGVLLHIDSPGGMVDGTREAMDALNAIGKPKMAYTDGLMASAAYWIGSAVDAVYASPTATVGSVGVVATHVEYSEADKQAGVKTTYIYNGAYKRLVNDAEPLTEEGQAYVQDQVDALYEVFTKDVANNRGTTTDAVKAQESRVYIGEQALGAGIIDGVMSMSGAYNRLKRSAGIMELNELKAEFPDLYSEVIEIGKKSLTAEEALKMHPQLADAAAQEAVEADRARVQEIREACFPGQESLVSTLESEGITADEARKRLIADQKARMDAKLESIEKSDDGVSPDAEPTQGHATAKNKGEAGNMLDAYAKQYMAEQSIDYTQAFDRAKSENPELLKIYLGR